MKITKLGHCCLLIEEGGLRILTDPGIFSTKQNELKEIDLILITHGDMDHLDINSLKNIIKNNPSVKIITNNNVLDILKKENINNIIILENGKKITEKGVLIEGFGEKHELIYETMPQRQNTGYLINNKFFFPGDAFTNPDKQVEILALNVSAPWMKVSEAIEYAKKIKPKFCLPIHDGYFISSFNFVSRVFPSILAQFDIGFILGEIGKEYDTL